MIRYKNSHGTLFHVFDVFVKLDLDIYEPDYVSYLLMGLVYPGEDELLPGFQVLENIKDQALVVSLCHALTKELDAESSEVTTRTVSFARLLGGDS